MRVSRSRCGGKMSTYMEKRLLALDTDGNGVPAQLDVEIFGLVLCVNGNGDVEVLDGLLPFVWQLRLLLLFL